MLSGGGGGGGGGHFYIDHVDSYTLPLCWPLH